jgi:hypothetical protein
MNRACPLPIDWLDFLQGRNPELDDHLRDCISCRSLLDSLRELEKPSTDWASHFSGRLDAVWHEERVMTPSLGEFWWSARSFDFDDASYANVDRIVVLVISAPEQDHQWDWLDVVPVDTEVENATATDFELTPDDSTLETPLRVLFGAQCKSARGQLDSRIGSLTELGLATLDSVLSGKSDPARWGPDLAGPDDPRVWLDPAFEEALLRLRTPYLLWLQRGSEEGPRDSTGEGPPSAAEWTAVPLVLKLTRKQVPDREHEFSLAAQTERDYEEVWELEGPPFKLSGRFDVEWESGRLMFVVLHFEAEREHSLRLRVLTRAGRKLATSPFKPRPSTKVPVADGYSEADVAGVEAEVVR